MTKISVSCGGVGHIVRVDGHAGYAEHGKDIVCASVAMLCNIFIAYFGEKAAIETGEGYFYAAFQHTDESKRFLDAAVACFEELARQFPENVKLTVYKKSLHGEK